MTKSIWINLPVKDLKKSEEFFTQLGFSLNNTDDKASLVIGDKNVVVNFLSPLSRTLREMKLQIQSKVPKYCFPLVQRAKKKWMSW